jgi:hypothetical protein
VDVPALDAEATAAIAAFVAAQRSIAAETSVERQGKDSYDVLVSPKARAALPAIKRAAREAARRVIGAGLAAGAKSPKVLSIQVRKALLEAGAAMQDPDSRGGQQPIGSVVGVEVQRPDGHPTKLGVVLTLSLPCGSDGSLYVLEAKPGSVPAVAMAVEANGYSSIREGQLALTWRLSLPDERGNWFAVVASSSSWCSSMWRGIHYRVLVPGDSAEAPRLVLSERDSARIGMELCTLETGRDDFAVHYYAWTQFSDDVVRPYVHRYVRRGAGFERTQPIVERPIDLPGEWARMPWAEARRFVPGAGADALEKWHDRLQRGERKDSGKLSVVSEDTATGRTRFELTCSACKVLPGRVIVDVRKDGAGWAIESIAQP